MSDSPRPPPISVERLLALVKLVFLFDESWESWDDEWAPCDHPDYPFRASFFVASPRSRRDSFSPLRVYASATRVKMALHFSVEGDHRESSENRRVLLTGDVWGSDPDRTFLRLLEELFKRYMQGDPNE